MAMVSTDSRPLEPEWDGSDSGIKDLIVELKNYAYQRNNVLWVLETDDVRRAAAAAGKNADRRRKDQMNLWCVIFKLFKNVERAKHCVTD
eukprot:969059-Rhodomonas_salina.1